MRLVTFVARNCSSVLDIASGSIDVFDIDIFDIRHIPELECLMKVEVRAPAKIVGLI